MRALKLFEMEIARDMKGEKLSNCVNKIENHVRICQIHTGNADFFLFLESVSISNSMNFYDILSAVFSVTYYLESKSNVKFLNILRIN
jgi:hypothetical protein